MTINDDFLVEVRNLWQAADEFYLSYFTEEDEFHDLTSDYSSRVNWQITKRKIGYEGFEISYVPLRSAIQRETIPQASFTLNGLYHDITKRVSIDVIGPDINHRTNLSEKLWEGDFLERMLEDLNYERTIGGNFLKEL